MIGIELRNDYGADDLRALARKSRNGKQARRLMALAGVADGLSRTDAAAVGLMDRQTLRDWVHRFNTEGPDGLIDRKSSGPKPKLSCEQLATLTEIVAAGPDRMIDGVVRWRCADLATVIKTRFGVAYHESSIVNYCVHWDFPTSARGLNIPNRTLKRLRSLKKLPADAGGKPERRPFGYASRDMVPG